ncbi:Hypothetical protein, putative [Bodo saltans]|uniref:Uncharacterized protein n=1 Tax=Bodo saltans TaxID=75058 RepID=A0A0S4JL07_BODSA|nr:Hypothetical protein, putative [Bodo saltans]|eukprot:CUG91064.1 Hypothetical protein, putative [Bodo saltans]
MSESGTSTGSIDDDEWNRIPCSRALWKWRSLHTGGSSIVSSRGNSHGGGPLRPAERPASWPSARGYGQLVYHDGKLYLHGGQSTINEPTGESLHYKDLQAYDIESEQWTTLPSALHDRMAHSMHVVEFKGEHLLLVYGGFDPQGLKPELFDLQRKQWLLGSIGMCERRMMDEILLEREESSSSETPSNPGEEKRGGSHHHNNEVGGNGLTTDAMVALSSTDFLSRPQHRMRKRMVKRPHHFEYRDSVNRYLHSSVQSKTSTDASTKIFMYGGTDSQSGKTFKDLVVIELTDTIMDDSSSHNPCFEMTRPECGGDSPGARLGHQACMLGTDAMLLYGGMGDPSDDGGEGGASGMTPKEDLYLVFRLDLATFMWSTIDVNKVPPCRMLFCMCSDQTNSRIIVFGGRHTDAEEDDVDEEYEESQEESDDGGQNKFVDAFIGQITADIEPTNSAQLKHNITWRRAASHDGPFPREISVAACCSMVAGSTRSRLTSEDETKRGHGVHCYIFGGENCDAVCMDGLTELTIDANALQDDDEVAHEGADASLSEDRMLVRAIQEDEVPLAVATTDSSAVSADVPPYRNQEPPSALGLSNTGSVMSIHSHSTASPTTIGPQQTRQSSMLNAPPSEEVPCLLQALVDAVSHTNEVVRRGFDDMRQRFGAVEGRLATLEDRMLQLERRDNGSLHPHQQLINASLRESIAAINKDLALRR